MCFLSTGPYCKHHNISFIFHTCRPGGILNTKKEKPANRQRRHSRKRGSQSLVRALPYIIKRRAGFSNLHYALCNAWKKKKHKGMEKQLTIDPYPRYRFRACNTQKRWHNARWDMQRKPENILRVKCLPRIKRQVIFSSRLQFTWTEKKTNPEAKQESSYKSRPLSSLSIKNTKALREASTNLHNISSMDCSHKLAVGYFESWNLHWLQVPEPRQITSKSRSLSIYQTWSTRTLQNKKR